MDNKLIVAGEFWSSVRANPRPTKWWQNATVIRHINRIVCGEQLDGAFAGSNLLLNSCAQSAPFRKAISIGCGNGSKEIGLVARSIVESFDLYEISDSRIEDGEKRLRALGLSDRVKFFKSNAIEDDQLSSEYDLIYWNNALHHMLDTNRAVAWSRERLRKGGLFFMDDFVGPTRFQWTDRNLEFASKVRRVLPPKYLVNPDDPGTSLPVEIKRPDPVRLSAVDPTEAADSSNILPAIQSHFPNAQVIFTGGAIYHLALSGVLANFDENDSADVALLSSLLLLDEALASLGENHYAVAYSYA